MELTYHNIKKFLGGIFVKRKAFLSNIILLISLVMVIFLPSKPFKAMDSFSNGNMTQFMYIFLPAMAYAAISKDNHYNIFKIRFMELKDLIRVVIIAILMTPITMFIANGVSYLFNMNYSYGFYYGEMPLWFIVFSVVIIPSICEEIFFRGAILHGYRDVGVPKGIFFSSLIFALFHLNIYQFSYTLILGIVMAITVHYTQSIFSGMIIHGINNLTAVIFSLPIGTQYKLLEEFRGYDKESLWFLFPIALGSMVVIFVILKFMGRDSKAFMPIYTTNEKIIDLPLMIVITFSFALIITKALAYLIWSYGL